jgi:hypothetical protein
MQVSNHFLAPVRAPTIRIYPRAVLFTGDSVVLAVQTLEFLLACEARYVPRTLATGTPVPSSITMHDEFRVNKAFRKKMMYHRLPVEINQHFTLDVF